MFNFVTYIADFWQRFTVINSFYLYQSIICINAYILLIIIHHKVIVVF